MKGKYPGDKKLATLATLAQNLGNVKRTARESGVSTKTIRRWRDGLYKTATPLSGEKSMPPFLPSEAEIVKDGFDWEDKLDDAGKITLAIFKQTVTGEIKCPHCTGTIPVGKDHEMGVKWMSTFAKLYASKVGAMRIQVAIDARQQALTVSGADRERIEAELRPGIEKEVGRELWGYIESVVCDGCKERLLEEKG